MLWRRIAGVGLMGLGGVAMVATTALIAIVVVNYVEWENAADALGTVALATGPAMLAGVIVLAGGRWVYGDWRAQAPIRKTSATGLRLAGVVMVAVFSVLFVMLILAGVGPENRGEATVIGLGVIAGLALLRAGMRMGKPRARRRKIME